MIIMIIVSILSHKVTYINISVHTYIYVYIYIIYIYIYFFFLSKLNRIFSLSCCMSFASIFALKTRQQKPKLEWGYFQFRRKRSRLFVSLICYWHSWKSMKWLYFHLSKVQLNNPKMVSTAVHQAKHLELHFRKRSCKCHSYLFFKILTLRLTTMKKLSSYVMAS